MEFNEEVFEALLQKKPVVALESTVIAHGLPYPQNLTTAEKLIDIVRENGAIPAIIAVFEGRFHVGLNRDQIEQLATDKNIRKISKRDLPVALARKLNCATTVATTSFIAHRAGIKVFATGGIGGVHRGLEMDISADLPELAQTPITVVCSGAKTVLDLSATREWLETHGVCVLGYGCDEMPGFYLQKSGLPVDQRVETPEEAVQIIRARDELELPSAILLTVPVPAKFEMDPAELEQILANAIRTAEQRSIRGKQITPFLLAHMAKKSIGKTLDTNIALLKNNARVAAQVATYL